jgi:cellulose synthase/poly-beta-1,6-N-acetylglucosamine synthase-like glycosyltransferase
VSKITIVSFISRNESVNDKLFLLYRLLKESSEELEMLVYCNDGSTIITKENVKIICSPNTTKYKRILMALSDIKSDYILFVDNDISPDTENIKRFLDESVIKQADISWGIIGVSYKRTLVSKLVIIDKLLSHKIIRPTLWRLSIGISVPGQIFFINRMKFQSSLPQYDTVFDDLTIGICAKQNKLNHFFSPLCLGYERPSFTLLILAKQRARWAKGFYQSIVLNLGNKSMLPYIFIHGIAYHILLIVFWCILYLVYSKTNWLCASILWLSSCYVIADRKLKYIVYAGIYTVVFPFIHLMWFISLLYYSTIHKITNKKVG